MAEPMGQSSGAPNKGTRLLSETQAWWAESAAGRLGRQGASRSWRTVLAVAVTSAGVLSACASLRAPGVRSDSLSNAAEERITVEKLAGYVGFLADDSLEGRGPGTRADQLTQLYLATTFQALGLQPGGPNGHWEQPFELLGVTSVPPQHWPFRAGARTLALEDRADFVAASGLDRASVVIDDAEVVFVGYGMQAPEYSWDDFKGVDLRGKILLMLNNDPDWDPNLFAGERRLYYGRWTYKYESAARQGAVGAIIIHTPASAGYPWQTVVTSWSKENSRLPDALGPLLQVQSWITDDAARRLVAFAGRDLDALTQAAHSREFAPVPLGVTTHLELHNQVRRYTTANILGVLPGADDTVRGQFVVYSAHHDHLGMGRTADDKTVIYNGALDNAAGIAQLLAVAEAFATIVPAPRRSVLFLAAAAEEQGLLGSEYFAQHPTVAAATMVANINFDGANIWGRTRDAVAIGFGRSTLDAVVETAAKRQGRVYHDEEFPERGMFYRSDQFNFARIGVPALLLRSGTDYVGRPPDWGRTQIEAWIAQHYHQPSDDFIPTWDLTGMVDDARLALAVGLAVANADDTPKWNPGDEFEAVRNRMMNGEL